jgi:hypothetical protein
VWGQSDGAKQKWEMNSNRTRERKMELKESLFDLNLTRTLIGILNKDA